MPDDPTPHGREILHQPPDRAKIPQPRPSAGESDGSEPSRQPQPPLGAPQPVKQDPLAGSDGLPAEFLP